MHEAIHDLTVNLGWKLTTLFRVRAQYSLVQFVTMYKSQVWSSIEWATPAIFHATRTLLGSVDRIQNKFLRFLGMPADEALINYKVAPLALRRKIAMIGLIHRCATGQAPKSLCDLFPPDHRRAPYNTRQTTRYHHLRLADRINGTHSDLTKRSIFGLVKFYNVMPMRIVQNLSVKHLQGYIQSEAILRCKSGMDMERICSLEWF